MVHAGVRTPILVRSTLTVLLAAERLKASPPHAPGAGPASPMMERRVCLTLARQWIWKSTLRIPASTTQICRFRETAGSGDATWQAVTMSCRAARRLMTAPPLQCLDSQTVLNGCLVIPSTGAGCSGCAPDLSRDSHPLAKSPQHTQQRARPAVASPAQLTSLLPGKSSADGVVVTRSGLLNPLLDLIIRWLAITLEYGGDWLV